MKLADPLEGSTTGKQEHSITAPPCGRALALRCLVVNRALSCFGATRLPFSEGIGAKPPPTGALRAATRRRGSCTSRLAPYGIHRKETPCLGRRIRPFSSHARILRGL